GGLLLRLARAAERPRSSLLLRLARAAERRRARLAQSGVLLRLARAERRRARLPERLLRLAHAAERRRRLRRSRLTERRLRLLPERGPAVLPGRLQRLPERGLDLLRRLPERRGLLGHDAGLGDAAEHRGRLGRARLRRLPEHRRRLRRTWRLPEHGRRLRRTRRGGGGLRRAPDEREVLRRGNGLLARRLPADVGHGRIGRVPGRLLPAFDRRPR